MKNYAVKILMLVAVIFASVAGYAQSAKDLFGNAKDAEKKDQYAVAAMYCAKALKADSDHKGAGKMLQEIFPQAVANNESKIKQLEAAGGQFAYDDIYTLYSELVNMYTAVAQMPIVTVKKETLKLEVKDYNAELKTAQEKAAEAHYQEAVKWSKETVWENQLKTFEHLNACIKLIPNYKECRTIGADLNYNHGIELSTMPDRASKMSASTAMKNAQAWVEGYKDAKAKEAEYAEMGILKAYVRSAIAYKVSSPSFDKNKVLFVTLNDVKQKMGAELFNNLNAYESSNSTQTQEFNNLLAEHYQLVIYDAKITQKTPDIQAKATLSTEELNAVVLFQPGTKTVDKITYEGESGYKVSKAIVTASDKENTNAILSTGKLYTYGRTLTVTYNVDLYVRDLKTGRESVIQLPERYYQDRKYYGYEGDKYAASPANIEKSKTPIPPEFKDSDIPSDANLINDCLQKNWNTVSQQLNEIYP